MSAWLVSEACGGGAGEEAGPAIWVAGQHACARCVDAHGGAGGAGGGSMRDNDLHG